VIVRVGSTRPAKVDGVREALHAIARVDPAFADVSLEPHDLTHLAPRQPMSIGEIIAGARTRAHALRPTQQSTEHKSTEHQSTEHQSTQHRSTEHPRTVAPSHPLLFSVGVEGGLHDVGSGLWSLQSWAAVTDGERWGYGAGPSVVLPTAIVERVLAGEELGDVIDRAAAEPVRGTRGAWGVLTLDLIGRGEAFRLAALAAFAPFYNARAWSG
jgi:non-canonical (house-cleaning) NTP pyrophosphatase